MDNRRSGAPRLPREPLHFSRGDMAVIPPNPFGAPIARIWSEFRTLTFSAPWIPQLVQACVYLFLLIVICSLYLTIGILEQLHSSLVSEMQSVARAFKPNASIENSAYALQIGVYFLLALPFGIVLLPFRWIGAAWHRSRLWGVIVTTFIVGVPWGILFAPPGTVDRFLELLPDSGGLVDQLFHLVHLR